MKTKRVVGGGSNAFAGSVARQSGPLLLTVMLLGATALACKMGNSGQENGTSAGPAAVAQGADVVRYSGMEVNESGQAGIRQAVQARRAADWNSTTVATLYPGTMITRVARYGNYSLVAWTGSAGAQQGWVDSNVAFSSVRLLDAGIQPPAAFGATTVNQQPTTTTPPVVTATPTGTAPPKATATAPTTGFKPLKLN
jgi:hypothetical protein